MAKTKRVKTKRPVPVILRKSGPHKNRKRITGRERFDVSGFVERQLD